MWSRKQAKNAWTTVLAPKLTTGTLCWALCCTLTMSYFSSSVSTNASCFIDTKWRKLRETKWQREIETRKFNLRCDNLFTFPSLTSTIKNCSLNFAKTNQPFNLYYSRKRSSRWFIIFITRQQGVWNTRAWLAREAVTLCVFASSDFCWPLSCVKSHSNIDNIPHSEG